MKTLKSIAITLAIVVNVAVMSFAQVSGVIAGNNTESNKIFVMTSKYMKTYPTEAYGYIYGKTALTQFLNTQGLEKVFVFNGIDDTGMNKIVFKGGDKNGQIIGGTDPYDDATVCPPICPKSRIAEIGSPISETYAHQLIGSFQRTHTNRAKAQIFERSSFETVLAQNGAEGIYLGHALNEKEEQIMILAGVDVNGNIMWDGVVINNSVPVPAVQNVGYPATDVAAKK